MEMDLYLDLDIYMDLYLDLDMYMDLYTLTCIVTSIMCLKYKDYLCI